MIPSAWDGSSRRVLRAGVAALAAIDLIGLPRASLARGAAELTHPLAPRWLIALGGSPAIVWTIAAIGLLGALALALGRRTLGGGAIALAALIVLEESFAARGLGPSRGFFYSGSILCGWLGGAAYARTSGRRVEVEDAFAEAGAVGTLAAVYVNAGLSKLFEHGFEWANDTTLRVVLASHHRVTDHGLLANYVEQVVQRPWVAMLFAVATLIVELGALSFLFDARARAVAGILLFCMHENITLLTGIGYASAKLGLLLLCVPWPWLWSRVSKKRPARETVDHASNDPAVATRAAWRWSLSLTLVATAAYVLPIRRYTRMHERPTRPFVRASATSGDTSNAPGVDASRSCGAATLAWAAQCTTSDSFRVTAVSCHEDRAVFSAAIEGDAPLSIEVNRASTGGLVRVGTLSLTPIGEFADWAREPARVREPFTRFAQCVERAPLALSW